MLCGSGTSTKSRLASQGTHAVVWPAHAVCVSDMPFYQPQHGLGKSENASFRFFRPFPLLLFAPPGCSSFTTFTQKQHHCLTAPWFAQHLSRWWRSQRRRTPSWHLCPDTPSHGPRARLVSRTRMHIMLKATQWNPRWRALIHLHIYISCASSATLPFVCSASFGRELNSPLGVGVLTWLAHRLH